MIDSRFSNSISDGYCFTASAGLAGSFPVEAAYLAATTFLTSQFVFVLFLLVIKFELQSLLKLFRFKRMSGTAATEVVLLAQILGSKSIVVVMDSCA